jgi:hypothetical protein
MDERNSNYELETARNGLTVPIINGVYLHSIYNPLKEAETYAENFSETLKKKNTVLILGLGFGYHIVEVAKLLNKTHATYKIIVLETNENLIEEFKATRNFEDKNIEIVHYTSPEKLYDSIHFIKFLMTKPSVLKHEASYALEIEKFSAFLKYKSSAQVSTYRNQLKLIDQTQIALDDNLTLAESAQRIVSNRKMSSPQEYLTMALTEVVKYESKGKNS